MVSAGGVWTSTDGGHVWSVSSDAPFDESWTAVASSSDGRKLVAVAASGAIWISSDDVWRNATFQADLTSWVGVASSGDGSKLVGILDGGIWRSEDGGFSWENMTMSEMPVPPRWAAISCSSDGSRIVVGGDTTWYSSDEGQIWSESAGDYAGPYNTVALASSSDGMVVVAGVYFGMVFTSLDGGRTWARDYTRWTWSTPGVASSSDGSKLVAGLRDGHIITGTLRTSSECMKVCRNDARSAMVDIINSDCTKTNHPDSKDRRLCRLGHKAQFHTAMVACCENTCYYLLIFYSPKSRNEDMESQRLLPPRPPLPIGK